MTENTKKPATKRRGKWIAAALIAVTGFGAFGGTAHAATTTTTTTTTVEATVVKAAKTPIVNSFGVRW